MGRQSNSAAVPRRLAGLDAPASVESTAMAGWEGMHLGRPGEAGTHGLAEQGEAVGSAGGATRGRIRILPGVFLYYSCILLVVFRVFQCCTAADAGLELNRRMTRPSVAIARRWLSSDSLWLFVSAGAKVRHLRVFVRRRGGPFITKALQTELIPLGELMARGLRGAGQLLWHSSRP